MKAKRTFGALQAPTDDAVNAIGGTWLAITHGLEMVQALAVQSRTGTRRATIAAANHRLEIYQEAMRPEPQLPAHLTFMLKHEAVSLELLARLFERIDPDALASWITQEPNGQYARRACFLYEWLTGRHLGVEDGIVGGNYCDALDPRTVLTASVTAHNARWRIRDNMPGSPDFCPVVRLTPTLRAAAAFACNEALQAEEVAFGADILRRSAVWMTLRESRSSFEIEGEQDQTTRIQRFASVLAARTGLGDSPLDPEGLAELQASILGPVTTLERFGLRQSPVFVGQSVRFEQVVHYVAPPWERVEPMVRGLQAFMRRTATASAITRAAVAAFGFVYIHPLADGNGRVHRFLVNDTLRRDDAVPAPFILPVSALITENAAERAQYDAALEAFSKPFMARYQDACRFTREPTRQPDGVWSNFSFTADAEALPAWRFPDLTSHVEYTAGLLERTIRQEMHRQADFFRSHDRARSAVKDIIEGPDAHLDAIIRSVRQNGATRTNKLEKQFPALANDGVWERIVKAVHAAFAH